QTPPHPTSSPFPYTTLFRSNIDNEHMYLDPIKVTLLTPGMEKDGTMSDFGIPASIVAKYLDEHGIVVEKTGPYNLLFLFSIGIDKTKALSLLRALTDFKRAFDLNLRADESPNDFGKNH